MAASLAKGVSGGPIANSNSASAHQPTVDGDRLCLPLQSRRSVCAGSSCGLVWEKDLGRSGPNTAAVSRRFSTTAWSFCPMSKTARVLSLAWTRARAKRVGKPRAGLDLPRRRIHALRLSAKGRKTHADLQQRNARASQLCRPIRKVLWEFNEAFDKRSVSSPVIAGDLIIGLPAAVAGGNFVIA